MNNKLFEGLEGFGLNDLNDLSLYNDKAKDMPKEAKPVNNPNPEDCIYDKKVECPICCKQICVPAVKTSSIHIISRDTDFMILYQDPNPMFYDAWMCKTCGYAAMSNRFNSIIESQKKLIKNNISLKWKFNKEYPRLYNLETAIEIHQLALLNSVVKMARDSEKAMICLRLAWLHRLKKSELESGFLSQALQGFIKAYEKEACPIAGLNIESLRYLIGELYMRLGDDSNALQWFSRVIVDRNAKEKIKNMARDQKDKIFMAQKMAK